MCGEHEYAKELGSTSCETCPSEQSIDDELSDYKEAQEKCRGKIPLLFSVSYR